MQPYHGAHIQRVDAYSAGANSGMPQRLPTTQATVLNSAACIQPQTPPTQHFSSPLDGSSRYATRPVDGNVRGEIEDILKKLTSMSAYVKDNFIRMDSEQQQIKKALQDMRLDLDGQLARSLGGGLVAGGPTSDAMEVLRNDIDEVQKQHALIFHAFQAQEQHFRRAMSQQADPAEAIEQLQSQVVSLEAKVTSQQWQHGLLLDDKLQEMEGTLHQQLGDLRGERAHEAMVFRQELEATLAMGGGIDEGATLLRRGIQRMEMVRDIGHLDADRCRSDQDDLVRRVEELESGVQRPDLCSTSYSGSAAQWNEVWTDLRAERDQRTRQIASVRADIVKMMEELGKEREDRRHELRQALAKERDDRLSGMTEMQSHVKDKAFDKAMGEVAASLREWQERRVTRQPSGGNQR